MALKESETRNIKSLGILPRLGMQRLDFHKEYVKTNKTQP